MGNKLERVDLDPPAKVKGFLGSYFPPPQPVSHFINQKLEELYSVKRMHIIVNPFAGKRKGKEISNLISSDLDESNIASVIYSTENIGHAEEIVSTISFEKGDALMSVGGDGTLSEIITGLLKRDDSFYETIPVSIVPSGSGNSQANDMEIEDYRDAVQRVVDGRLRKMDVGKVTYLEEEEKKIRFSHNLVGWGLGVDANILAEKMRFLGPIRYDIGSLLSIIRGKVRNARCYIDGNLIDSSFILLLIQNTKTGGDRLTLAPMAHVDDGKMDLGVIYHISRFQVLKLFNQLKASGSHVWNPNVEYYRFKHLRIETEEPTAINVDGENLGTTPLEIEVIPSALKVFH
ncbi:MAG: diacylglycerol kinase family lipid kinase [Candidatus Poseidoniia archaeon]|nr:diacylglycerol kinase family lipid kinase [Candidatus Poseidoniia archaeon]